MFNLKSNSTKVLITLASRVVTAIIGIIFVPIYVKIIGAESYGLVAFYSTLVGSLAILDLGLSTAISRQIAILTTEEGKEKEIKDLIFSVEIIYWLISFVIGIGIVLLAKPISLYWINSEKIPIESIEKTVMLMGLVFAFQFPASIYNGALIGMNKQINNAITTVLFTVFKAIGVIFILIYVNSSIEAYFLWQAAITLVFTLALRIIINVQLKRTKVRANFSSLQLKKIWKFAAGMTGISLITFFITQIDKIIVSKYLLLEYVGYYNLAFLLAGFINQIVSPIQPVIFPKLSSLVAQNKKQELINLYHKSCKWISIVVFPLGFTLILFAKEILILWTKNDVLATQTAPILQVVAAGTICNCMMWMPYFYLLAKGNTTFTIYQNLIAAAVLVPLLFWWTNAYGAIGASYVWLTVNAGYVVLSIPIFHSTYLKGELWNWYKKDVAIPLVAAGILVITAKYFQGMYLPELTRISFATLLLLLSVIYFLVIPELRTLSFKIKNTI